MKATLETAMNGSAGDLRGGLAVPEGSVVENAWNTIKTVVQAAIDVVGGIIKTVMALIRGDWSGAWDGIAESFRRLGWDRGDRPGLAREPEDRSLRRLGCDQDRGRGRLGRDQVATLSAWDGIKTLVQNGIDAVVDFVRGMGDRLAGLASGS
ncbi:MAG: hypothetical protein M5T61_21380 [Acidimicrobiia bacterium]|nr:hypothetical protein [Acidimicrobiia bacterium]